VVERDDVAVQAAFQDGPPGMAVEDLSPASIRHGTDVAGGTEELHALLCRYSDILAGIEKSPGVLWASPERSRNVGWLRFPAPRALVRTLLARHISRCVSALRRSGARRVALTDEAPGPLRDLKMLERFEQSLPPGPRLNLIAPIAILGSLLIAYIFAFGVGSSLSKLLADLTSAAVDLDRRAALEAFKNDHVQPQLYAGVAIFITWSVVLIIVPLLPVFSVKRRMLQRSQDIEARVFAALDCSPVDDFEPGLLVQVLLTAQVAVVGLFGIPMVVTANDLPGTGFFHYFLFTLICVMSVGLLCLSAAAAVELRGRYAERRTGTAPRHVWHRTITVISLWLVVGIAVFMWINSVVVALNGGRAI
jgi:hypothetical protein